MFSVMVPPLVFGAEHGICEHLVEVLALALALQKLSLPSQPMGSDGRA